MKKFKRIVTVFLFTIVFLGMNCFAKEGMTGLGVMQNNYNRSTGDDMTSDLTMTLINSAGDRRVRKIKQFQKDFGDMDKKIMFFIAPADVRNTSFMNWSYDEENKDDDQWIYLPALKRVKRISSDSKSDYFMGSDFTYDDLGDRHPSEDSHKILKEEKINDEMCYVVESMPKQDDYMYSKTISWVSKDNWLILKKEFYDEDGDQLKILKAKDYQKIDGYWMIIHSVMHNVQEDHKTRMELENVTINSGISDNKFSERTMKRGL